MTEQQIQAKILTYLQKEIGAYCVKVVSATRAGVPDILACVAGKFVAIEVKRPETINTVSELQQYNLDLVKKCGGIAFVATSVNDVKAALEVFNDESDIK